MTDKNKEVDKPLFWLASSYEDLKAMPIEVKRFFGFALSLAQKGMCYNKTKPFKLENESGLFEIVENYDGNTYRAIFTVRYAEAIYVIHCFQKKSPHGIKTSLQDVNLIRERLKRLKTIILEGAKNG